MVSDEQTCSQYKKKNNFMIFCNKNKKYSKDDAKRFINDIEMFQSQVWLRTGAGWRWSNKDDE